MLKSVQQREQQHWLCGSSPPVPTLTGRIGDSVITKTVQTTAPHPASGCSRSAPSQYKRNQNDVVGLPITGMKSGIRSMGDTMNARTRSRSARIMRGTPGVTRQDARRVR